jgi:hypothetical protein
LFIIIILAYVAEVLPIIFFLLFLKRNKGEGLWVIFLYCVLSLLTEGIFALTHEPAVYYSFVIVQFLLFSYFFYSSLKDKKFKYIPVVGAIVYCVVAFSNLANQRFDSISAALSSVLVITYCILLLYELIREPNSIFVYYNKKFWVIIAFFLYFSATLFLYLFFTTLTDDQRRSYWAINNFFEILKNILFSVSFIMKKHVNRPVDMEYIDN